MCVFLLQLLFLGVVVLRLRLRARGGRWIGANMGGARADVSVWLWQKFSKVSALGNLLFKKR